MDGQLKRGILPFCILKILESEDTYGYDIVKKTQKYIPDTDESTIYAVLRRICKDKYASSYIGNISNGPQRK